MKKYISVLVFVFIIVLGFQNYCQAAENNQAINNSYINCNKTDKETKCVYLMIDELAPCSLINASGPIKWSVTNSSVATISDKGVLKPLKVGETKVLATCNGVTYTSDFDVCIYDYQLVDTTENDYCVVPLGTKLTLGVIDVDYNYRKASKWKLTNKKIASFKQKGKKVYVTGTKLGKTTISATYKKRKYKAKIEVVKNEYKFAKYSKNASRYKLNALAFGFSKISRDAKGNLIIKGDLLNNRSYDISTIRDLTVVVKHGGKTIAKQTFDSISVDAYHHTMSSFKLVIDEKNVKNKYYDYTKGGVKITTNSIIRYK